MRRGYWATLAQKLLGCTWPGGRREHQEEIVWPPPSVSLKIVALDTIKSWAVGGKEVNENVVHFGALLSNDIIIIIIIIIIMSITFSRFDTLIDLQSKLTDRSRE